MLSEEEGLVIRDVGSMRRGNQDMAIPFISEIGNNLLRPPHPCVFKFGNPKLSLKIICREWRVLKFKVGRK